ncbi:hypothetical protein GJ496_009691 [Pomphorhynchus laevis]|nr:hypothetical protein GJ496_009691 [Pomphorhynchus laevis]
MTTSCQNDLNHNNTLRPFTIEAPVVRGSTTISPNLQLTNANCSGSSTDSCSYSGQIRLENGSVTRKTISPKMPYVLGTMVCKLNSIDPSEFVEMTVRSVIKEIVDKCAHAVKLSTSKLSAHRYQTRSLRQQPVCRICGANAENAITYGCDRLHSENSMQIYNCLYCGRVFPLEQMIIDHIVNDHRTSVPTISLNRKPFLSVTIGPLTVTTDLNDPQKRCRLLERTRTTIFSSLRCPICKMRISHSKSNFIPHMIRYHRCTQLMIFRATSIDSSYLSVNFERMLGHILMNNLKDGKLTCLVERDSISVNDLIEYQRKENYVANLFERNLFRCLPCLLDFESDDEFVRHFYCDHLKHPSKDHNWTIIKETGVSNSIIRLFVCPHCVYSDTSLVQMNKHLQKQHSAEKIGLDAVFRCHACKDTLAFSDLDIHFEQIRCRNDPSFCISLVTKVSDEQSYYERDDDDINGLVSLRLTPAKMLPLKRHIGRSASIQRQASIIVRAARANRMSKSHKTNDLLWTRRNYSNFSQRMPIPQQQQENKLLPMIKMHVSSKRQLVNPWLSKDELIEMLSTAARKKRALSQEKCSSISSQQSKRRALPSQQNSNFNRYHQQQPVAIFACSICRYKAYSRDTLKDHTIVHNETYSVEANGDFVCFRCPFKVDSVAALFEHEICHTSYSPYRCTGCRSVFFDRFTAVNHLLVCVGNAQTIPSEQGPPVRALWKKFKPFNINLELSCYDMRELNSVKFELDNLISTNIVNTHYDHSTLMDKALSVIAKECGGIALLPPLQPQQDTVSSISDREESAGEQLSNNEDDDYMIHDDKKAESRSQLHNPFQRSRGGGGGGGTRKRRRGFRFCMTRKRRVNTRTALFHNDNVCKGDDNLRTNPSTIVMLKKREYCGDNFRNSERMINMPRDPNYPDVKREDIDMNSEYRYQHSTGGLVATKGLDTKKLKRQCEICGFRYGYSTRLKHNHARQHKLEQANSVILARRRYRCSKCPYASENSVDLRKHEYRHLNKGPFYCRVCREDFCNEVECFDHLVKCHHITSDYRTHIDFYVSPEERNSLTSFRLRIKAKRAKLEVEKPSTEAVVQSADHMLEDPSGSHSTFVEKEEEEEVNDDIKREKIFTPTRHNQEQQQHRRRRTTGNCRRNRLAANSCTLNEYVGINNSTLTWDPSMLSLQQNNSPTPQQPNSIYNYNITTDNELLQQNEQSLHPAFTSTVITKDIQQQRMPSPTPGSAGGSVLGVSPQQPVRTKRAYVKRQRPSAAEGVEKLSPYSVIATSSTSINNNVMIESSAQLRQSNQTTTLVCVKCHDKMVSQQQQSTSNNEGYNEEEDVNIQNVLLHAMHCHSKFRPYSCHICKFKAVNKDAIRMHCVLKHGIENKFTKSINDNEISMAAFVIKERFLCSIRELQMKDNRNSINVEFGGLNLFMTECSPLSFKCQKCCICFQHAGQLAEHLQLASHIIQCRLCNQHGRHFPPFIRHFQKYHALTCIDDSNEGPDSHGCNNDNVHRFRCVICQMNLNEESLLTEHLLCVHHLTPDDSLLSNSVLLSQLIQTLQASTAVSIYRDLSKIQLNARLFREAKVIADEYVSSTDNGVEMINRIKTVLQTCPVCLCIQRSTTVDACTCVEFNLKTSNNILTKYGKRSLLFNMNSIVESHRSNTQITQSWASAISPFLQQNNTALMM